MATLSMGAVVSSVNEGQTVQITVSSSGSPNGTPLYWRTINGSIPVSNADFSDNITSGVAYFSNNVATIYRTVVSDALTEGSENFQIMAALNTSYTGAVTTGSIVINDTSTGGFTVTKSESIYTGTLNSVDYSVNGGSWTSFGSSITVPANATVQYRCSYTKTSGTRVYVDMSETFGAYAAGSTTTTSTIYTTTSSPVTSNSTLSIILSPNQI